MHLQPLPPHARDIAVIAYYEQIGVLFCAPNCG